MDAVGFEPEKPPRQSLQRLVALALSLALVAVMLLGFDTFLTAVQNVAFGLMVDQSSLSYRLFMYPWWRKFQKQHLAQSAEMLVKLGNLGSVVEDPPANEKMLQVAAAAPAEVQAVCARALFEMAELSPERFANGVRAQVKDLQADPALKLYFEELGRRGGAAPQVERFLRKFATQGEPEERQLCRDLLARFPGKR